MKSIPILLGSALSSLMLGCASTPVALAPVGPNPLGPAPGGGGSGGLVVYSAWEGRSEGDNPTWRQHADYDLYDQRGEFLQHVNNTVGHYATAPRTISLPPGEYVLRAPAEDYLSVAVPVVIDPGRTTRIHLDDAWRPAPATSKMKLVRLPSGVPVGWRVAGIQRAE